MDVSVDKDNGNFQEEWHDEFFDNVITADFKLSN